MVKRMRRLSEDKKVLKKCTYAFIDMTAALVCIETAARVFDWAIAGRMGNIATTLLILGSIVAEIITVILSGLLETTCSRIGELLVSSNRQ